ncbi:hypothetical protein EJ06DRAFT_559663 [Trichodelitschia bisporula]|uniref:Uncharacterized protein n=1 Tax=Trichodelitschia bisporula TaxID=703511 RepID=A0A6G1HKU2_9PEZI|nr:hypothetical protein EJ06DRAFT_559663 [Trichodelitschia bisporula]
MASTFNFYFNRRNLAVFSLLTLGGSYFVLKSRTLAAKRRQRLEGDFHVDASRSGGGI